jgi:hypothetical protein
VTTEAVARDHAPRSLPARPRVATRWAPALSVLVTVVLASATLAAVAVGMLHVGVLLVVLLLGAAVVVPPQPRVIAVYLAGATVALAVLTAVWLGGWTGCADAPGAGTPGCLGLSSGD